MQESRKASDRPTIPFAAKESDQSSISRSIPSSIPGSISNPKFGSPPQVPPRPTGGTLPGLARQNGLGSPVQRPYTAFQALSPGPLKFMLTVLTRRLPSATRGCCSDAYGERNLSAISFLSPQENKGLGRKCCGERHQTGLLFLLLQENENKQGRRNRRPWMI